MCDSHASRGCVGYVNLSYEIRSMIWKLCLPSPRILTLRLYPNLESRNPQPSLLHINKESREYLLRTYKLIRTQASQFAFNPLRDSIYFLDQQMGTGYTRGHHQALQFRSAVTNTTLVCTNLEELKITKIVISENDIIEDYPGDLYDGGPSGARSWLRKMFLTQINEVSIIVMTNDESFFNVLEEDDDPVLFGLGQRWRLRYFLKSLRHELDYPPLDGLEFKMPLVRIVERGRLFMVDPYCTEMKMTKRVARIPSFFRTVKRCEYR